jgi:short chain dehydrogenase
MSLDEVVRMIQVNTVAVTSLTHLFGRDMKERRRGRILLVSSVCGAVSGIATVAVYAATKAFENSFGVAIGKELEPFGVGVTCLIPGAVRGTEFRSRSNSHEALCWKIPFYSKTPPAVAECGVRAMLRGDTEVMPGVLNRMFVKVLKPILPQRLHNLLAEIMWNPLNLPFRRKNSDTFEAVAVESIELSKLDSNTSADWIVGAPPQRPIVVRPQLYLSNQASPRQLVLEDLVPICNHETDADAQVLTENPAAATSQEADGTSSGDSVGETATTTSNGDLITNRHIPPDMKQDDQRNTSDSNGEKSNANHHSNVERIDKEAETQNAPSPSGELDLLLDQYKRHRALSIDDPWSSGFNDRYLSDPMLPSFTEEDSIPNGQEV